MKFGLHIPLLKPIERSFVGFDGCAIQLFLGSNLHYAGFKYSTEELMKGRKAIESKAIKPYIHASYVYNFCSEKEENRLKSIEAAIKELDVGAVLGAPVVFHIGSRKDKKKGVELVIQSLKDVVNTALSSTIDYAIELDLSLDDFMSRRKMLIENAAGEGSKIGSKIEEIETILKAIPEIGFCADTCHLFSAGELKGESISFDLLKLPTPTLIHLNDSKTKFGGCCDRHATIYSGELFKTKDQLREVLDYAKSIGADLVTETGEDEREKISEAMK